MGWIACIKYFQCFYWHFLDPALLGIDYHSLATYFIVMVALPLFLEIPLLSKIITSNSVALRNLLAIPIGIAMICGFVGQSARLRSTSFLVAMFLVTLRLALVGSLPAATAANPVTERDMAPWGATLGLLFVWARRLAVPPMREIGESYAEVVSVGIISFLALAWKTYVETASDVEYVCKDEVVPLLSEVTGKEAETDPHTETVGDGARCQSVGAGAAVACLLVLVLWLLDAPWVVSHFVGVTGSIYPFIFTFAFTLGICQTLVPFITQTVFRAACTFVVETFIGCGLLNIHGIVGFVGGCILALGAPGICVLVLKQASMSIRCNVGCAVSSGGLTTFFFIFAYMGTLTNSTPLFSSLLWPKFWLFALVLCVCLAVALFFATGMTNADLRSEGADHIRIGCLLWLGISTLVNASTALAVARHLDYRSPQDFGRGLVVGTYNVQQGYTVRGTSNSACVAEVLARHSPHIVGLQESDSVHLVGANPNIVSYLAGVLGLHESDGPSGDAASMGVSILSQYELYETSTRVMPLSPTGVLNRFLTKATINVNGTSVVFMSVHTEWFGDPAVQVAFIAEEITRTVGPLIVVGDFNMDISGQNEATIENNITTNAFQPLLDLKTAGLRSATPISAPGSKMESHDGYTYCPSKYTTVDLGDHTTPGYQLDYIWYRGLSLVGEVIIPSDSIECSDHLYMQATFAIP
eukprot:TRINITY_DN7798_c0_g1_i1.p1 TRINITY_DN7798_c0_g1~~TRINITY_DN7798_c0_g1_i1.p1  ORF type:complete len:732 (-),score=49.50 TRINITY_DN7798_c0_g1_i1:436-2526(-)